MFINYLEKVVARENLSLLVGLSMKGETIEEITAAARVMRNKAISIKSDRVLIDSCGTGGDCKGTFNISTTVALLMAAAGLSVAKHGNRSVSSKSGSADLLEALGININLSPQQVEYCLNEIGFAFLFAPYFHKAMKYAARPRRELGLRTIFNILGPLTNPAGTRYQILGVYQPDLVYPMAAVLKNLGIDSAMVVHGAGGIDEFSLAGENKVAYLRNGQIEEFYISPEEVGLQRADLKELIGGTAEKNREITLAILKGERGAKRDVVLFNAAAAFLVSGLVDSWAQGIELAAEMIDSGRTLKKLEEMIEFTNSLEVVL